MADSVVYTAIIEKDGNTFGAFFPDLHGCVSAADNFDEVVAGAAEALAVHLAFAADNGIEIAAPSRFEDIDLNTDPDVNAFAKVPVLARKSGRAARFNITMDANLMELVDQSADAAGLGRSGFLAVAVWEKISNMKGQADDPVKGTRPMKKKMAASSGAISRQKHTQAKEKVRA